MRTKVLWLLSGLLVGSTAALALTGAQAASTRTPQFENEHVKVWKTVIMPNSPLSMHRHEHPRTLVALRGGTVTIVQKSGERQRVTWETGKAYWLTADGPRTEHGDVNEGSEPIEVMIVEMK
jgi:quercetin dioxygenase-like cupin family protein